MSLGTGMSGVDPSVEPWLGSEREKGSGATKRLCAQMHGVEAAAMRLDAERGDPRSRLHGPGKHPFPF